LVILGIDSTPEMCPAGGRSQEDSHLSSPKLPFLQQMNWSVLHLPNHLQLTYLMVYLLLLISEVYFDSVVE